jgi:aspartyl-tRNA(Asn)/glutamyl-tRNA(Gln) amidotransferase subunit A
MPNEVNRRDFILRSAVAASIALSRLPAADAALTADPDDLAKLTIADASKKIRSGETTCTDLTRACTERSRTYNPKINAYITLMHEEAQTQAVQLDAEAKAGKFRGPLHGVPLFLSLSKTTLILLVREPPAAVLSLKIGSLSEVFGLPGLKWFGALNA